MAILMEAGCCCCWTGFMLAFSFCHLHSLPGHFLSPAFSLPFGGCVSFPSISFLVCLSFKVKGCPFWRCSRTQRTFLAVFRVYLMVLPRSQNATFYVFSTKQIWTTTDTSKKKNGHWNIAFYISNAPSHSSLLHAFLTFKFDNIVSQVWCLMLANNNNNQKTWIDIKIDTRTRSHTRHIGPKRKAIQCGGKEVRTRVVEEFRKTVKENGEEYENNQTSQNVC